MKRTFCILLALLMAASAVSCGGSTGSGSSDTTASSGETTPPETELTDGLPDVDMNGFELSILHHDKTWLTWAKTDLVAEEENGDLINDAIFLRNREIEERFNCKINVEGIKQVSSVFKQLVAAGDDTYDIIMQYGIDVLGNVEYLSSMTALPYINTEAVYWNPNASSIFRIGDKQVAMAGNFTLSYISGSSCFMFNKQLYEDLKVPYNIYDLVKEGKWVTDKFIEIAKMAEFDLNGDAVMDKNDRFGVTGSHKAFFNTMINGAGIKYVEMDKDNYPYFNIPGNEKAINFMQKLLDLTIDDPYCYFTTSTNVDNGPSDIKFANGQLMFSHTSINGVEGSRSMEIDFGLLPAPKYDEAQEMYYSQTNIGEIATLPRSYNTDHAEYVGMLLEALAFHSQQNMVPTYKEVLLKTKYSRDDESSDMLNYIFDGISFDYGVVVWQNSVGNVFMKNIYLPKSNTIASTIASIQTALETSIEDLKAAVAEMP